MGYMKELFTAAEEYGADLTDLDACIAAGHASKIAQFFCRIRTSLADIDCLNRDGVCPDCYGTGLTRSGTGDCNACAGTGLDGFDKLDPDAAYDALREASLWTEDE